jgi:O-methyltransferase
MNLLLFDISIFSAAQLILVIALLFIGFKYVETFWSYRISKPFAWETAVNQKLISKELLKTERSFRDKVRFYNLWFQIEQLKKNEVKGAFAELGVYEGDTAKAIHQMDNQRVFYLFDTFEGFVKKDLVHEQQKGDRFSTDMFSETSIDKVEKHINGNQNIRLKPGFFPDTTIGLENELFALVHIDADLYAPTVEALKFFYPRLNKGGVIIVHDYNHNWDGIPKAINEFMATIPESLIELPDWQGSAMIIKNAQKIA